MGDIAIVYGKLSNELAWDGFLAHLRTGGEKEPESEPAPPLVAGPPFQGTRVEEGPALQPRRIRWAVWVVAVPIVLGLVSLAAWAIYYRQVPDQVASVKRMAHPLPDKPSIAVLPFANLSGDPRDDYISDGLSEQIITSLCSIHRLFVIARSSTFVYKGKPVKVQKVAEDLGVQYVLEGSVLKSGDRVRITAQLVDALTGRHVWSERYDREIKDYFKLQDELTIKILHDLKVELTEGLPVRRYTKKHTANLKAYEKFNHGVGFYRRFTKPDTETARGMFEEALALDPDFYNSIVMLGFTHLNDMRMGWSENPARSLQKAYELARKAIALDDAMDSGHSLLGLVYTYRRQYDLGVAEAERAVALNPNGAFTLSWAASPVGFAGRWEQSLQYEKQSMRLNPFHHPMDYVLVGRACFMMGKYEESVEALKKAVKLRPNILPGHVLLAAACSSAGRESEAAATAREVLRINPRFTLDAHARTLYYKNKADIEREIAALRGAGLR
ncbi:MAG: hypothetical protein HY892_13215 [Deltaproteobacteria bacterium]|nr:hypothetical protein [Deltaproteobacteria bacterium]